MSWAPDAKSTFESWRRWSGGGIEDDQHTGRRLRDRERDRIVYEKGVGVSGHRDGERRPRQAMLFSDRVDKHKMLTAAALVALADEGKIALDAPLAQSVPGLASRACRG